MKKILDLITEEMEQAFADAGYEKELARVTLSNRPDLCEYQCNGAMAGAKKYHKAPIMIAEEVVAKIPENGYISGAEAVKPGFINLKTNHFIAHKTGDSLYAFPDDRGAEMSDVKRLSQVSST